MLTRPQIRRIALLLVILLGMLAGFASACTPVRHVLITADPLALGPEAQPDLFEDLPDEREARVAAWTEKRSDIQHMLDAAIYGASPPAPLAVSLAPWTPVETSDEAGRRSISRVTVETETGASAQMTLALITPEADRPIRGLVLVPSECGLQAALHDPAMPEPGAYTPGYCDAEGWLINLVGGFFGEWIAGPPISRLLDRGYAVVSWHESDIAPDRADLHVDTLTGIGLEPRAEDRPGVISVWAWMISRAIDAVETDPRFADTPFIAYGHSRRGKAVLLAAARDERIAVTLAHQSGTGGAALQNDRVGEPIAAITSSYPHWFATRYSAFADNEDALPVDQHALLALIAPRAVLIGAAWRDAWSDPSGAFRAAEAASLAWTLQGADGLNQARMADFDPSGGIASHIRPGTHGVSDEDWTAFLAFMDAHTVAP